MRHVVSLALSQARDRWNRRRSGGDHADRHRASRLDGNADSDRDQHPNANRLDDTHRDVWLNTVADGTRFPLSTMPGEQVDHVFAGQMGPETLHFLESVMLDHPPMVSPESARAVMECYLAADLSAESGEPIEVPMNNQALAAVQDLYKKFRAPV